MAEINYRLLEHPAAQRKPETHDEWLNFVKVLVEYTSNPDAIDVAVEGGASLANALPNASRNTSAVKELQTWVAQDDASDENRREVPIDEAQFENSSLNGEDTFPNVGLGHVPDASVVDTRLAPIFGNPAYASMVYDRGLTYWNEASQSLNLRTEADGHELELGKQVAFRVLNISGVTITKGQAVYGNGAIANVLTVSLAQADDTATNPTGYSQTKVLGLMSADTANNQYGYVIAFGEVINIDTTAFASGGNVYLSDTVPGGLSALPNKLRIKMGYVSNRNVSAGKIAVSISNELSHTFNGVSFNIKGMGVGLDPTINKHYNVLSIIRQAGVGVYRVTVTQRIFDANPSFTTWQDALDNVVESWKCRTTVAGGTGVYERRAYITNLVIPAAYTGVSYFDFTYYEVIATAVGAPTEMVPVDMLLTDTVTFFGQMMPFTAP